MSWESTAHYYELINQWVAQQLWWLSSAQVLINSVNFAPLEQLQSEGNRDEIGTILLRESQKLESAGVDILAITSNTMHIPYDHISKHLSIPMIHIADATAQAIVTDGHHTVGLLWTSYTMEMDFYRGRLEQFGLEVIIPNSDVRWEINRIIFEELCLWVLRDESRQIFIQAIEQLQQQWATCVILWCTEIGLLIKQENSSLPVYDTTVLHAQSLVDCVIRS